MTTTFPNQSVRYTDTDGNTASLTPGVGLVLSNGVVNLTIDQTGFNNGTQSLSFTSIYGTVGKCESISYTLSSSSSLCIINNIVIADADPTPNNTATMNYNTLQFSSPSTNNKLILSNDNSMGAEPYIRLTRADDATSVDYTHNGIVGNNTHTFNFTNGTRFFKQNNPMSYNQPLFGQGFKILRETPFVYVDSSGSITYLILLSATEYLDDDGKAGWSTIVSNNNSYTIDINIDSADFWYSHASSGFNSSPITIARGATAAIYLIYDVPSGLYGWAVSTY